MPEIFHSSVAQIVTSIIMPEIWHKSIEVSMVMFFKAVPVIHAIPEGKSKVD